MAQSADEILVAIRADNSELKAKLAEVASSLDKTAKDSQKSAGVIKNAFKGVGAFILAQISIDAIKGMVNLAGEIDTVKTSFNNLTASVKGGGEGLLQALKTASAGTVAELDMMKSSNLAIQLMGEQVADKLPKMMEIARAAARAKGTEVSKMFDDIIVASGRQSVMILDNLGISSATAARYQEEYAISLGKTRETLNQTQKAQAFFFAVMKAGKEFISTAGIETLTLGERMQVMKARGEDAAGMLAEKMIPGLNTLMNVLNDSDGKDRSVFAWMGDQINDLIVLISRLVLNLKGIPLIWGRWKKDMAAAMTGSESEKNDLGKRADYDVAINSLKTPAEKVDYLNKNKKNLLAAGYTEQEYGYTKSMYEAEGAYSWNRTPNKNTFKPTQKTPGTDPKQLLKDSEFYSFLGDDYQFSASAAKMKEEWIKLRTEYGMSKDQMAMIDEAYYRKVDDLRNQNAIKEQQKQAEILSYLGEGHEFDAQAAKLNAQWLEMKDKYGKTMEMRAEIDEAYYKKLEELRMQDGLKQMENFTQALSLGNQLTSGLSEINSLYANKVSTEIDNEYNKRKEAIENSTADEKTKQAQLDALDKETAAKQRAAKRKAAEDTKSLTIAETLLNIPAMAVNAYKSMVGIPYVGPVLGAVAAAAAIAFGVAKVAMISATPIPSFREGFVPATDYGVPMMDHFVAAIGKNEAVMNARATAANSDILAYMNETGERYQGNQSTVVHTHLNLDGKEIASVVDKHRSNKAYQAGLMNYGSRSVY